MKTVHRVFLLLAALVLLSGSFFIIFFTRADLVYLGVFYLVALPPLYLIHLALRPDVGSSPKSKLAQKIKQSAQTETLEFKSHKLEKINPTLLVIRSIFPLDIFTNTMLIEEKSITVVNNQFIRTGWSEIIPISEVASVEVVSGPFVASLRIKRRYYASPLEFANVWKTDANRAKVLIEELMLKGTR